MGEKLVIGPYNRGLQKNRLPFAIDNDSFPLLVNAYQWRGRIKRKRGTTLVNRLQRSITLSSNLTAGQITLSLPVVPGSINLTGGTDGTLYTDPNKNGILTATGGTGSGGTIDYHTGLLTITAGANEAISGTYSYYPLLPSMGLRDLILSTQAFPATVAFDTKYSYSINTLSPYSVTDISFYKNPPSSGSYVAKGSKTPFTWNGQNYQQFYTINYQGCLWATNGVQVPYQSANIGMQFAPASSITTTYLTATTIQFVIANCPLVVGDFVFANEFSASITPANANSLNFQAGYVTSVAGTFALLTVVVTFPNANIANDTYSGGMLQYLTNTSDSTRDCLRWYDGTGWVNFCPPLSELNYSIAELPAAQYYLVGAKLIAAFKDRIIFFGPVVQTSNGSPTPIYLQDTAIYSQNGFPFYTASFQGSFFNASNISPLLVPSNQSGFPSAYWADQTGFGGFISSGVEQAITSAAPNEDALIIGFSNSLQTRFVYTGNDILPFSFYIINAELGTASTFSTVIMDEGIITRGPRGFIITAQTSCKRIDLDIPDQVFEISNLSNGSERFCSQRDYINEWIYFTYPSDGISWIFPNQTLQYNYRDDSWAIFNESYTSYGAFRAQTGYTWGTIGTKFPTWGVWNEPWGAGASEPLEPKVICGNAQGFIFMRDQGTSENPSLYISNISFAASITGATQANPCVLTCTSSFLVGQKITISGVTGMTQLNGNTYTITAVSSTTVTISVNSIGFGLYVSGGTATPFEPIYSPNHCLNNGDYIVINSCLGTVSTTVNGNIYQVANATTNGFSLSGSNIPTSGTYTGLGTITRMYVPNIVSKQFPVSWSAGRKTRIGPQQYLFTKTNLGQVTINLFLSMDAANPYNLGPIIPEAGSTNDSLIYSATVYTCPESTNLGLTPFNINMLQLNALDSSGNTANAQQQIWHRLNTSLIGDTVQFGITLSDAQMRDPAFHSQFAEIEFHSAILDLSPSWLLS